MSEIKMVSVKKEEDVGTPFYRYIVVDGHRVDFVGSGVELEQDLYRLLLGDAFNAKEVSCERMAA
jgi:hypothetical protein